MKKSLRLLEAFTSFICHELAGSVGTIDNCLELIDDKNELISKQAKQLVIEESHNLGIKIHILRECYGLTDNSNEIYISSLENTIKNFFKDSRIQLEIYYENDLKLDPILAKIITCLIMVNKEHVKTMVMKLFVKPNELKLAVTSNKVISKEDYFMHENNPKILPITVKNIRHHYINMLCKLIDYEINLTQRKDVIEYNLVKKF